jgi:hypothetical protein
MPTSQGVPKYRLHKARNCAVVTLDGRNVYLGPFGSPESHAKYAAAVAEWQRTRSNASFEQAPDTYTCGKLALDYLRFAEGYYVKRGEQTSQVHQVRQALKALVALYEDEPAATFGPVKLNNLQQHLIGKEMSRVYINKLIGCLRLAFKWAASEELVPAATDHALQTVGGLKRGRCSARETAPVEPVDEATVNATLKHLSLRWSPIWRDCNSWPGCGLAKSS